MNAKRALALNSKDNVAVAVENIESGEQITIEVKGSATRSIKALEPIPFGFKVALMNVPEGGSIVKHGEVMGRATKDIKMGEQVHIHNVEGMRAQREQGGRP